MRLHHLGATAFGPFVETVEVDFDALSGAGLFLLSGATGAGKSSVLDAVCFALYGAVPGDRHLAHRLRSDQAPPGLAPLVELEVTLSGRRFRLVRSPAWERPKKRGTGLTREPAKVTLSERRDGAWSVLSSRLDEVGDLVSGLLGMNLDQFCQVALLPQGHFQAFLRADSAQRHHLLARLFRTGRFERVEAWLRDHRLELRRSSQTHLATVGDLVSRLSEVAGVDAPAEHLAPPDRPASRALRAWADSLVEAATVGLHHATSAALAGEEASRQAAEAYESGRAAAHARARVVEAATTLDRLLVDAEEHGAAVDRLEAGHRALALRPLARLVDERAGRLREATHHAAQARAAASAAGVSDSGLEQELARLTEELSRLTVLLPAEQRLSDLSAERSRHTAELAAIAADDEVAVAETATLRALRLRLAEELRQSTETAQRLTDADTEARRLRTVAAAHAALPDLRAELVLATSDHAAATGRRLDLRERLLDTRERRIAGMAAEIAGGLAVGDDCPVCGSADHPHPARPSVGHPDAADERAAQKAVDDAQVVEHALELRLREATVAVTAAEEVAVATPHDQVEARLHDAETALADATAAEARRPALAQQLESAEHRHDQLQEEASARRVRAAALSTACEHLDAQLADLTAQVVAVRGPHEVLSAAVEQVEWQSAAAREALGASAAEDAAVAGLDEAETAFARAALEAGFDDAAAARACEVSPAEMAALEEQTRRHVTARETAEAVMAEQGAAELLAGEPIELEPLEAAALVASTAAESARAARDAARDRAHRVTSLAADVRSALDAWEPVLDELEVATEVSSFVDGKAPDNRWQMRLSAYVLSHRLSQVVDAANARLAGMSDQRYSLEHVAERGAREARGGLSLVVRDDWSGESRDPATLSGGETFVVSLALALGLADVVSHEAGGADLATLFVDEGFGSLDAETLDDVLGILDTLRENGRTVGVVSHVAEMRDRIPSQLLVTKARSGSTVRVRC